MKSRKSRIRGGYTLVELSLAILIGLVVGGLVVTIANQQFAFLRIYTAQSFLTEEAPVINGYMNRMIGQAERFRLHNSVADARNGTNAVLANANTISLTYQQPDGTTRMGILSFQNLGSGNGLYYYNVPVSGALPTPEWALTKRPKNVLFSVENGILRVRMTGPNDEEITYSGTMQQ